MLRGVFDVRGSGRGVAEDDAGRAAAFDGVDIAVGIKEFGDLQQGLRGVYACDEGRAGVGEFFEGSGLELGGVGLPPDRELVDGDLVANREIEEGAVPVLEVMEERILVDGPRERRDGS